MSNFGRVAPEGAVAVYLRWAEQSGQRSLADFLTFMQRDCHTLAGDVLTEDELMQICEISGDDPSDCDDALMRSAWP